MILTDEAFNSFKQAKALGINTSPNEIEYSTDGLLLGAAQDSMLKLYSSLSGTIQNIIHIPNIQKFSFIYPNSIIHSASNTLYFLSTFDNHYTRSFHGHENQVRMISVCSREDSFLSASAECVNYWDLRKRSPVYRINAIDPLGCISSSNDYAVTISDALLKIYDKRNTKGPKITTKLPEKKYREMVYSPDGSSLVVSGERHHLLVDSEGTIKNSINLERDNSGCITPDSRYFLCCSGGFIFIYHLKTRKKLCTFETPAFENTKVRFNPRYAQFVSASSLLSFWAIESSY